MAIHRQRARTPHSELVDGVELHVPQGFCNLTVGKRDIEVETTLLYTYVCLTVYSNYC